jgi:hypothetical protein
VGSIVAVAVVAVLLANTADSGNNAPAAKGRKPTATVPQSSRVRLVVGKVIVQNTGPPARVTRAIRRSVLSSTQLYVDGAILAPLHQGQVDKAYARVFDPGVRKAAARNDRTVLTEATTGRARGAVRATASRVRIDAIGDPTGKVAFAATSFTMDVKMPTPKGRLTIRRRTELTFANELGKWVVTAYRVTVRRSVGTKTTSQTITSSGAPNGVSS